VQFQWPNHWGALPMIKHMALLILGQQEDHKISFEMR
jgi:hypothetical protein